jgi:hypothetical protein
VSPLNPWLERALVSLAAGAVTTGALVATAEKTGKKKRKKKGAKGEKDDVKATPHVDGPGEAAVREAARLDERSMTLEELGRSLKGVGAKLTSVFAREKPKVDASGARVPDEVMSKDGKRISTKPDARGPAGKKRNGKHARGRRRKRRPQASLWDSAKESMRQTVKEVVHEEVKDTPVGSAMDALKKAGASIKTGASAAVESIKAAIPEDAGTRVKKTLDDAGTKLSELTKDADGVGKKIEQGVAKAAEALDAEAKSLVENPPEPPASATEVVEKLNKGVDVVGSWLKGPGGGPGSSNGGRRVRAAAGGDVVEAKDADASAPPAEPAPAPQAEPAPEEPKS